MFNFIKRKLGFGADTTPASGTEPTAAPAPHSSPAEPQAVAPKASPTVMPEPAPAPVTAEQPLPAPSPASAPVVLNDTPATETQAKPSRQSWLQRLSAGLKKTGQSISTVFTGTKIDDELYEELEAALLMADTGTLATQHLLDDLKQRVKAHKATQPAQVRQLLIEGITELLNPLESTLQVGVQPNGPTVMMVAGVNGAGKTTTIGKLTHHLANAQATVLLAAADTFRAAAREQLGVWAHRNTVDIISQEGGDPAAVSFDAVSAGKARHKDVVIVDTAGRLPTQLHLMEELKKIKRVVTKADETAPHEVILVIDGNTGQNALHQVQAFDQALTLTGLVVTKLDGTAKGGVLAAIAMWAQQQKRHVPVYFIGVGEGIEDLQTFRAHEFASALLSA